MIAIYQREDKDEVQYPDNIFRIKWVHSLDHAVKFFADVISYDCYNYKSELIENIEDSIRLLISSESIKQMDEVNVLYGYNINDKTNVWEKCNIYSSIENKVLTEVEAIISKERLKYEEEINEKLRIAKETAIKNKLISIKESLETYPELKELIKEVLNDSNMS